MPGPVISGHLESYRYFDTLNSGVNPIAPYQVVANLAAADYAGNSGSVVGEAVRPAPAFVAGTSVFEDRPVGITEHGAKAGTQVSVRVDGTSHVMAGAAVAANSLVFAGLVEQRTNSQSPLINLFEANLPVEPGVGITYNLSMIDDIAITAQSGSANRLHLPVGYTIDAATAKYDLIRVKLELAVFYA